MTLSLRQAQQQKERREFQDYSRGRRDEDRVTIGDMVGNLLDEGPEVEEEDEE